MQGSRNRSALVLFAGVIIFLLVGALWWFPKIQVASFRTSYSPATVFEEEDRARTTLAQIIGGAFVLLGLGFTGLRFSLAREGQITDRFTRAVEQLGHSEIQVRVGATYALERIARESEGDRWSIVDLLAAFVRHRRPRDNVVRTTLTGSIIRQPPDVQSALTVIGRLVREEDAKLDRLLDLRDSDLQGANLRNGSFCGAQFTGSLLNSATLADANLARAVFLHAHLEMADLSDANLQLADFEAVAAQDADFNGACLAGANLKDGHFEGADFNGADIDQMKIINSHLEGADLQNTSGMPFLFPVAGVFFDDRTRVSPEIVNWIAECMPRSKSNKKG